MLESASTSVQPEPGPGGETPPRCRAEVIEQTNRKEQR